MTPAIFKEANKIWERIAKDANEEDLRFELEVHKKLLNFFQVGDYYYYIFNVRDAVFDFVSSDITRLLGYKPEEVDVPFFIGNIHPDDQPWFLSFENKAVEFLTTLTREQISNYKIRYDYRIRHKNSSYIRILQQVVTIQVDENKRLLRTLGVHTDISHIKQDGLPVLSFIGLNGEPSCVNVDIEKKFSLGSNSLTAREREVLGLLIEGKSSDEISKQLFISKQTVLTHRKNLLRKTNCTNTAALTSMAIRKGWV